MGSKKKIINFISRPLSSHHGMILEEKDKKAPFFGPLGKKGNRKL